MQDKIVPGVIAVIAIIALIFVVRFVIAPEEQPAAITDAPVAPQPSAVQRPEPQPPTTEPDTTAAINTPPAVPLPEEPSLVPPPLELENSDPQILLAVADFAPELGQWLLPDEQIRKWVLTVDLMADGKLPKRYRPVDYPMDKFAVEQQGTDTVAAEGNYARMNAIVGTLSTIDPKRLAGYYREWLPLLEKAYREQGKPDTFDQRFRQTISQILGAEQLSDEPALKRPSVLYRYADETLEEASDVDKLLWRMGHENSEQLQNFLRELRYELDNS